MFGLDYDNNIMHIKCLLINRANSKLIVCVSKVLKCRRSGLTRSHTTFPNHLSRIKINV